MARIETLLEQIERHIQQGEEAVERQTELVTRLIQEDRAYDSALALLQTFKQALQLHRDHLELYKKQSDESEP